MLPDLTSIRGLPTEINPTNLGEISNQRKSRIINDPVNRADYLEFFQTKKINPFQEIDKKQKLYLPEKVRENLKVIITKYKQNDS